MKHESLYASLNSAQFFILGFILYNEAGAMTSRIHYNYTHTTS